MIFLIKPQIYFISLKFLINFFVLFMLNVILFQKYDLIYNQRCLFSNNYILMETTRPLIDCKLCSKIKKVLIYDNLNQKQFEDLAYSGQPLLVKNSIKNWPALNNFNLSFFRNLYLQLNKKEENECQFFPFRTKFFALQKFFSSQDIMVNKSWYIGWSNCNSKISAALRQHYQRPKFFPNDSESSIIDWIFMGYSGQGSSFHLDYVHRPSWQAQISGSKLWTFLPPPECEFECTSFNITVNRGDMILINTNQWYHKTFIEGNQISITIGSEYD